MELRIDQKFNIGNRRHVIKDIIKDADGNPLRIYSICRNQGEFTTYKDVISILELELKEKELKVGTKKINNDGSVRKSMTSRQASVKKIGGHDAEDDFAEVIGGNVLTGQRKGDVRLEIGDDKKFFSVKSNVEKIQVFLYAESRFGGDEFGELNGFCKNCICAYPEEMKDYLENKNRYKDNEISTSMKQLRNVLEDKDTLSYFLHISFFGNRTEFLVMRDKEDGSTWHIFHYKTISESMPEHLKVMNSKARYSDEFDNQKVVLKAEVGKRRGDWVNVFEIEVRHDSEVHYRQLLLGAYRDKLFTLLQRICDNKKEIICGEYKIILYDGAIEELKFLEDSEYEKEN